MRKLYAFAVCITMLFALCSCSNRQPQKLMQDASVETSGLALYCFDGEKTTVKWIFQEQENKIVSDINKLKAYPVDAAAIPDIKLPCYGLEISDSKGEEISLTYSNGYWLDKNGSVYKAKYDLEKIFKEAESETTADFDGGIDLPNSWILGQRDVRFYSKAGDMKSEKEGMSISFVSYSADVVTVKLKNTSSQEVVTGEYFTLQRQIDGIWYKIPPREKMIFHDIGYSLGAGQEIEFKCDLKLYGDLPQGLYRVEKEGIVAEFEKQ